MNKKYLQWLYGQLPELANKGMITQQNAEQIRQYYEGLSISSKKPLALIIFGTIGTFLIGLGIILLFAHNWEQLSRATRTVLSLMPTAAGILLCGWVLLKKNDIMALRESTATFLSLMVGASLALVCQTYHISGDSADFIMTWMLLIVPLVYLMDATIPAVIFLAGITSWTYHFWGDTLKVFLYWPLAAIVVPHFVRSLRKEMYAVRSSLFALAAALSVFLISFVMLNQKNLPGSWIIFHSGIFGMFYLIGKLDVDTPSRHWQAPFLFIGRIGILIMAFILTYHMLWDFDISKMGSFSDIGLLLNTALLVGIMSIYAFLAIRSQKSLEVEDVFYAALPLMAIFGCLFTYLVEPLSAVPAILFDVYILAFSVRYISGGIKQSRFDKLNTGILILTVLIILRFFDINIGFTLKGLTFIILGIGFLVVNIAMLRRREGKA